VERAREGERESVARRGGAGRCGLELQVESAVTGGCTSACGALLGGRRAGRAREPQLASALRERYEHLWSVAFEELRGEYLPGCAEMSSFDFGFLLQRASVVACACALAGLSGSIGPPPPGRGCAFFAHSFQLGAVSRSSKLYPSPSAHPSVIAPPRLAEVTPFRSLHRHDPQHTQQQMRPQEHKPGHFSSRFSLSPISWMHGATPRTLKSQATWSTPAASAIALSQ